MKFEISAHTIGNRLDLCPVDITKLIRNDLWKAKGIEFVLALETDARTQRCYGKERWDKMNGILAVDAHEKQWMHVSINLPMLFGHLFTRTYQGWYKGEQYNVVPAKYKAVARAADSSFSMKGVVTVEDYDATFDAQIKQLTKRLATVSNRLGCHLFLASVNTKTAARAPEFYDAETKGAKFKWIYPKDSNIVSFKECEGANDIMHTMQKQFFGLSKLLVDQSTVAMPTQEDKKKADQFDLWKQKQTEVMEQEEFDKLSDAEKWQRSKGFWNTVMNAKVNVENAVDSEDEDEDDEAYDTDEF